MSIDPLLTVVTLRRCTPPAVGPLLIGIRISCYISLHPSPLPRMVAMDILHIAMIPTSPHPGRFGPHQRRLPLSRVVTPPERLHTPIIPPSARLPPVSVIPQGLHDLIPWRLSIETADVMTETGIVIAVADTYKSTLLLPLIRCSLLEATPLLIAVTAPGLVLPVTTAHPIRLRGMQISQSLAGRTPPHGPRVNPLHLVPLLLNLSLSLTHLGGMIQGMMDGIQGS